MVRLLSKKLEDKVIVVGETNVGKSAVVVRYVERRFEPNHQDTIGASYFRVAVPTFNTNVFMNVWDTAGQERFRCLAPLFYREATTALLVFDITSTSSFTSLQSWVKDIRANTEPHTLIFLVGNKSDLEDRRQVTQTDAVKYAQQIKAVSYHEMSALTGRGVPEVFRQMAQEISKKLTPSDESRDDERFEDSLKLDDFPETKNNCC